MRKTLVVPQQAEGLRLDKFLVQNLDSLSRAKISRIINQGFILVNGQACKASFKLRFGQEVNVTVEEEKTELKPFDFPIGIIHEDNDIIVVDKPVNLVVHPPQKNYHKTLVNVLIGLNKELAPTEPLRPGVVHRLDKETSGVMVLAKNKHSYDVLVNQFKERKVKKEYRAIVWGNLKEDKMTVDLPLARDKKNRLKMKVSFLKSKKALTDIEVIKRLADATYLKIKLLTGRMHQIRVHLKFLGFPIVGDKKYGLKDKYKQLFLHAKTLQFQHPKSARLVKFDSAVPERFNIFLAEHVL